MEKQKNVPALRFPEFEGEWKNEKLGGIAEIVGGGTPDTSIQKYWNGQIEWFTPTELKSKYVSTSQRKLSNVGVKESSAKVLPVGTLLFTSRATVGEVSIALRECTTNQGFQSLIVKEDNNNEFVYYWITNNKKEFLKRASGSTFLEISKNEIQKIKITIPSLPEQTKIANFLTAIDTKIQQLTQKKALLEQYKKGVMQQLFSQKIRFKDENGQDYPDWEEKRLGDIAEITGGGTPDTSIKKYWNGHIEWFTPTELKSKYVSNSQRKLSVAGVKESSAKILPVGTVLFTSRATVGDVSIALKECTTNQGFQSFIVSKNYNNEFVYYWITKNKKEFLKRASGSTFLEISKNEIQRIKIFTPILKEQIKIANFLIAIDIKIETVLKQIEQTQAYKKGLLQQMFI